MGWAAGLMSVMGLLIVVAIAAQIVGEDRADIRRLRRLEAARADWATWLTKEERK